jgi:1,4-alpha-glucan branching enzyme
MKTLEVAKGRKVSFEVTAAPGSEVFVAGSFNNWDPTQHRMRDNPNSGLYKTALPLSPGRHEYKFIVNGEWRADPNCPDWAPNDQGSLNSVISL